MYKLVVVGTILATTSAHYDHPVNEEIIEQIKARATTWVPMEIEDNPLHHMTADQARGLLGTIFTTETEFPEPEIDQNLVVPTAFDSRTQWGSCIHPIRNQNQCGSCWAFGATETLSDRFCIKTNGTTNVVLSP
jgi:C1A family cysteine protease